MKAQLPVKRAAVWGDVIALPVFRLARRPASQASRTQSVLIRKLLKVGMGL